jgi:mRNA interferase MazF
VPVRQGDVYFVNLDVPCESEPGYPHFLLVVQSNDLNESDINTVVVCCLTTTLSRADAPGNVLLAPGEGGIREQSVVNVSQMLTVNKSDLQDKRGALDHVRMRDVIVGIRLILEGERGLP